MKIKYSKNKGLLLCMLISISAAGYAQISEASYETADSANYDSMEHSIASMALCDNSNQVTISLPDIIYKSPEVLAFERYGEYCVGEYTGNPQIAIPIYDIKSRDIEIPINLTYQGSGIKVEEEATWVGLGWNLSIGGCISRIPSGGVETNSMAGTYAEIEEKLNRHPYDYYNYQYYWTWDWPASTTDNDYINGTLKANLGLGWGEPDVYSVNITDKSFYFYINPATKQPQIIGYNNENYIIERVNTSWEVIDSNGYTYIFNKMAYSYSQTGGDYVSAWYLTEIISPTNASVYISYSENRPIGSCLQMHEFYDFVTENGRNGYYFGGYKNNYSTRDSNTEQCLVSRIRTDEQIVDFELSSRDDVEGANKLSSITVYSGLTGKIIKKMQFSYSYFTSNTIGGSWLEDYGRSTSPYSDVFTKRLKLHTVSDITNAAEPLTHTFEYHENIGLPNKASYSTDMWGYFNGEENATTNTTMGGHTSIPSPALTCIGSSRLDEYGANVWLFDGANRLCSPEHIIQCTLKRITYPTKGYTLFHFEPNDFICDTAYPEKTSEYAQLHSYSCQDINYYGVGAGPTTQCDITFTKPFKGFLEATFTANQAMGISINKMKLAEASVVLVQQNVSSPVFYRLNLYEVSEDLTSIYAYITDCAVDLPVGNYKLIANLPESFGNNPGLAVSGKLRGWLKLEHGEDIVSVGGGLRIRSIENYDHDNNLLSENTYEYKSEDESSSGILLMPIRMSQFWFEHLLDLNLAQNANMGRYSFELLRFSSVSSSLPVATSILTRGTVGYSCVKKIEGNSYTITNFRNQSPQEFGPLYIYTNAVGNGQVIKSAVYKADGTKVQETTNTFSNVYTAFKSNLHANLSGVGSPIQVNAYVYPFYRIWEKHASSETTDFTSTGFVANRIARSFSYNSENKQVCRVEENSSTNSPIITEYKYPVDFPNTSPYVTMVSLNMINNIITENKYEGTECIYKKKNIYTNQNGNYLPNSILYAMTGGNLEARMNMSYDVCGNLTYAIKDGTEKVCYLWSYNRLYPVAKIEGLSYSELTSIIPASRIASLATATNTSQIVSHLNIIRQNLSGSKCLVTTYTFDPSIGVTSITAPNGHTTTYQYDSNNRLSEVLDNDGNTLQKYYYNYKQ